MSVSPSAGATASTKRPLEDESPASGPTEQPDAKRPALGKAIKDEPVAENTATTEAGATENTAADIPTNVKTEDSKSGLNGHSDANGDTHVPDAPNVGNSAAATAVLETHPIQSTAGQNDYAGSHGQGQHHGRQDETGWIHVRSVISSAEAATVIGKGGENVSQIRRLSGAKCTVSDYARGAVERILTVSGLVDAVAKVRQLN